MKLISCEGCGVVIDTSRIVEPDTKNYEDYGVNDLYAAYDSDCRGYKAVIRCPTCDTEIFYHNGDTTGRV